MTIKIMLVLMPMWRFDGCMLLHPLWLLIDSLCSVAVNTVRAGLYYVLCCKIEGNLQVRVRTCMLI